MENQPSIPVLLDAIVKKYLPHVMLDTKVLQNTLPTLAKERKTTAALEEAIREVHTQHQLFHQDARHMDRLPDESVHLIVTSPPYWTLKEYPQLHGQLGIVEDYEVFLDQLDLVWQHCYRMLIPGGRLVIVVGDVCLARRRYGRHTVVPLHASIQEHCRKIGFDNLAPIIWYKIANAVLEVQNGSHFLGKPYEPNAIIKNDIEYILMQRKPGSYRRPTPAMRVLSLISEEHHRHWFQQVWQLSGASTRDHPAPFPVDVATRLIRMFSFIGDTVLDPFMGTATTNVAACRWGRNSIGFEIDPSYFRRAVNRLKDESVQLFAQHTVEVVHELPVA